MPRPILGALVGVLGLMLAACTDPASLPNEIAAVDDVGNTNMPSVQDRGLRAVGPVVLSAVPAPTATPAPQPTPTAAPTTAPSPTPSGLIALP